jgi:hypothetical protein
MQTEEKNDKKLSITILVLISLIFGLLLYIFYTNKYNQAQQAKELILVVDTTYRTKVLDSIKYNIIYRDSVIVRIKKEFEYEKEQALIMPDSDAIKLFNELVSE